MRRFTIALAAAVALLALPTAPAHAITNGVIDTEHPNVGVMGINFEPEGGRRFFFCSGTLIAPNVFLVAAHCVNDLTSFPPEKTFVTFDDNFFTASQFVSASAVYFDPAFPGNQNDTHDLGVIILSRDVTEWNGVAVEPADLPTAGWIDEQAAHGGLRQTSFVNVGYGAEAIFKGAPPSVEFDGYRKASTSRFMALTQTVLKELMNSDATNEGGVCFLDSGGPKFIPDTDTIVAVQSQGDPHCRAQATGYRLDTPEARAFLGQFVPLP
jgi:hypothetical protein